MDKAKIKAELRNSAAGFQEPWLINNTDAFIVAKEYCDHFDFICNLQSDDQRTFFLLVAEAL